MKTTLCCPKPELKFKWALGYDELDKTILKIGDVECMHCGMRYEFDHTADAYGDNNGVILTVVPIKRKPS